MSVTVDFFATPIAAMTIGDALLGSLAVGAATTGFGMLAAKGTKTPEASQLPQPIKPETMPTPDDEAAQMARKRKVAEISARSGRASTMLSDIGEGDKLGA